MSVLNVDRAAVINLHRTQANKDYSVELLTFQLVPKPIDIEAYESSILRSVGGARIIGAVSPLSPRFSMAPTSGRESLGLPKISPGTFVKGSRSTRM
jgi:hypothetical protein